MWFQQYDAIHNFANQTILLLKENANDRAALFSLGLRELGL